MAGFVIALSLSSMYFFFKEEWLVAKAKLAIFSLTCVYKVMFLGFCGQSISSCTVLNYNRKDVILLCKLYFGIVHTKIIVFSGSMFASALI